MAGGKVLPKQKTDANDNLFGFAFDMDELPFCDFDFKEWDVGELFELPEIHFDFEELDFDFT